MKTQKSVNELWTKVVARDPDDTYSEFKQAVEAEGAKVYEFSEESAHTAVKKLITFAQDKNSIVLEFPDANIESLCFIVAQKEEASPSAIKKRIVSMLESGESIDFAKVVALTNGNSEKARAIYDKTVAEWVED